MRFFKFNQYRVVEINSKRYIPMFRQWFLFVPITPWYGIEFDKKTCNYDYWYSRIAQALFCSVNSYSKAIQIIKGYKQFLKKK